MSVLTREERAKWVRRARGLDLHRLLAALDAADEMADALESHEKYCHLGDRLGKALAAYRARVE